MKIYPYVVITSYRGDVWITRCSDKNVAEDHRSKVLQQDRIPTYISIKYDPDNEIGPWS